jgi:1-hydroxycarotenoid 3,4-desaturase
MDTLRRQAHHGDMVDASNPVVIIGAGVAGLTAATLLAAEDRAVVIVERDTTPGGKMAQVAIEGRGIDCGPTVLTLADVFADLPVALPGLTRADILARHFWSDGATLDLFSEPERTDAAIAAFAGPGDATGYRTFASAGATILDALEANFMRADKPATPLSLMWRGGFAKLAGFTRLDPYRSLAAMVADHFADPRLRQLFGRYTTYCGSSPFAAPATLALIAEVERRGVWLVEGGMHRLAETLLDAAIARGATARFGVAVDEVIIAGGHARGVRLADGSQIAASEVIVTADAAALADGRLGTRAARGRRRFKPKHRSFSAFTVAMLADAGDVPLVRHNIAFADDSRAEFAALAAGRIPDDPTVYLCAQDRGADADAARPRDGAEAMLIVVNAPADGDTHLYDESEIKRCMTAISRRLTRSGIPLAIDRSRCSISTPSDFERRFPATGGALYGRASHGWMASFRRSGARTGVKGLYCAGGSVHPGAGVPMAALSGRAAVRAIQADRASTSIFRRAAMPGGMSTRSATADGMA